MSQVQLLARLARDVTTSTEWAIDTDMDSIRITRSGTYAWVVFSPLIYQNPPKCQRRFNGLLTAVAQSLWASPQRSSGRPGGWRTQIHDDCYERVWRLGYQV